MSSLPRVTLGRTGLSVGRLGVSASYGVPAKAVEAAYERGCNYLYWGSARRAEFADALRRLCKRDREGVVLVLQSYSRSTAMMRFGLWRGLRALRTDHADVLLLGWWQERPPARVLDTALALKAEGKVRAIALSTHNRKLAGELVALDGPIDVVHVRYNASHRGAEGEVFPHIRPANPPGLVSFTATRWGTLLLPAKGSPPGSTGLSASDCYRFVLTRPEVNVCLTGPANEAEMEEALRAAELGPLDEETAARVRAHGDAIRQNPPPAVSATLFSQD